MVSLDALRRQLKALKEPIAHRIVVWVDGDPEPSCTKTDTLIRLPDAVNTYD